MAAEISTRTIFLIFAVILVAAVMGLAIWTYHDKITPIVSGVLKNMGVYQITITNEEQFRGLLQCLAAAHYHFGFHSEDKLKEINFQDLQGTEMQGCTIKGKIPQKVHVKFKIDNPEGYMILASGNLMPPDYEAKYHKDPVGNIFLTELDIKGSVDGSGRNNRFFPFVEYLGIDCTPIQKHALGFEEGWAVIVHGGIVEKNSTNTVYCNGAPDNNFLNLASFRIYDGTEAEITIYRDRDLDVKKILWAIPYSAELRLDDVLVINMKITDLGIKEEN